MFVLRFSPPLIVLKERNGRNDFALLWQFQLDLYIGPQCNFIKTRMAAF